MLKIESITGDIPSEITQVQDGVVTFGRETDNTIVIDSLAVSRRHASISKVGSQWVFRDFGSTNGSWVNGIQIIAGQVRLIRTGDTIKLGDFLMSITETVDGGEVGITGPSLLLFFGDRFDAEVPFDDRNPRFVIGGPEGDMFIEGESRDQPQIIVVFSNGRLELTTGKISRSVIVNGLASVGTTALVDRDEVLVGPYRIIVNDFASRVKPTSIKARVSEIPPGPITATPQAYDHMNLPQYMREEDRGDGWESEAAKRQQRSGRKFIFDRSLDDKTVTGTLALDVEDMEGQRRFEVSSSHRFLGAMQQEEDDAPFAKTNELVLVIIGIVVFVSIIMFLLFLVLNLFTK